MKDIYHFRSEFRMFVHWVHLTVLYIYIYQQDIHRILSQGKHTSKRIKPDIPYAINDPPSLTNRFNAPRNWSITIHTKITEKMRSEPAIVCDCENLPSWETDLSQKKNVTCWECDSPKKTSILLDVFLTKKKGWHLFFGIFTLTFSPNQQKMDKFSVDSFLGEFWSSWKVIGVILMWILGKQWIWWSFTKLQIPDLYMFVSKTRSHREIIPGKHKTFKRLISFLLHCGRSGSATINSQCLKDPGTQISIGHMPCEQHQVHQASAYSQDDQQKSEAAPVPIGQWT